MAEMFSRNDSDEDLVTVLTSHISPVRCSISIKVFLGPDLKTGLVHIDLHALNIESITLIQFLNCVLHPPLS